MAQVEGIKVLRALLRYRGDMLNGASYGQLELMF
jgi:hypothetical protein